jgi:hemerythrin superfamily protein
MSMKETMAKAAGKVKKAGAIVAGKRGIFVELEEQHTEVSMLMKQAQKSDDEKTRRDLFSKIRVELLAHAKAEERVFYPVLQANQKTDQDAQRSLQEHQQIEQLINQLDSTPIASQSWKNTLNHLIETVKNHVDFEEKTVFPKAQQFIDDDEARELEPRFEEARQQEMVRLSRVPQDEAKPEFIQPTPNR